MPIRARFVLVLCVLLGVPATWTAVAGEVSRRDFCARRVKSIKSLMFLWGVNETLDFRHVR